MSREPENLVLRALRDIRADVAETKTELKSEMRSLRAYVASDILTVNAKIDATRKSSAIRSWACGARWSTTILSLSVTES